MIDDGATYASIRPGTYRPLSSEELEAGRAHEHGGRCDWAPWEYDCCEGVPIKRITPIGWVSFETVPPPNVGECRR